MIVVWCGLFDLINSAFSILSCVFIIPTLLTTYNHKKVVGVHWITPLFFMIYGFWNIAFYWHLGQLLSIGPAAAMLCCNAVWLSLVIRYR